VTTGAAAAAPPPLGGVYPSPSGIGPAGSVSDTIPAAAAAAGAARRLSGSGGDEDAIGPLDALPPACSLLRLRSRSLSLYRRRRPLLMAADAEQIAVVSSIALGLPYFSSRESYFSLFYPYFILILAPVTIVTNSVVVEQISISNIDHLFHQ